MNTCYYNFIQWLKSCEWKYIALSSRLKEAEESTSRNRIKLKQTAWGCFGKIASGRLWINGCADYISGGLYISDNGLVLPALNIPDRENGEIPILRRFILKSQHRIKSIMGLDWQVCLIENLLSQKPLKSVDYRVLTLETRIKINKLNNTPIVVRPATMSDFDLLWPLEYSYLLEEVIDKNSLLNEHAARRFFTHTLKKQLVFYAISGDYPLAKANTNARGWLYDQVGGVFVTPEFRNQGIGYLVMDQLLDAIQQEQRHCCLFVKVSNFPALHLYRSLGFQDRGKFRISYWIT